MQALYRNVLYSGIIFLTSFSSVFAADLQGGVRRASGPKFQLNTLLNFTQS
jgi:hypothetical protein